MARIARNRKAQIAAVVAAVTTVTQVVRSAGGVQRTPSTTDEALRIWRRFPEATLETREAGGYVVRVDRNLYFVLEV